MSTRKDAVMQVTRDGLLAALSAVAEVVETHGPIEVLGHVLFEVVGGVSYLRATDTRRAARVLVPAEEALALPVTLPHRELSAFVKALPSGPVLLRASASDVVVSSGASSLTLQGFPVRDFPTWAGLSGDVVATVPAAQIRAMLACALKCALDKDTTHIRSGVEIAFSASGARVQSTDGHRLFVAGRSGDRVATVLAPKASAQALCRLLANAGDSPVSVRVGEDWSWWEVPGQAFAMLGLSGRFPDMGRVLSSRATASTVDVRTDDMRRAMARVLVLVNKADQKAMLESHPNGLRITLRTPKGVVEETVRVVDASGHLPRNLACDARYLLQAPDMFDGEVVRLQAQKDAMSVTTWTCPDDVHDGEYLVMPMRA